MPTREEIDRVFRQCTRFLSYHYPTTPKQVFAELAEFTPDDVRSDMYGGGKLVSEFEAELAALLGKPAAVVMPSGTMAQQIALRIWAERKHNRYVAFHPTCHLETHEENAYREMHHLEGILVGNRFKLMTLDDLKNVRIPFATLLLELPQREIGGALPTWDDLTAMVDWARERDIILHMDGARLWETKPFYGRDYAEIAGLFDTVYVSFYKILGGITGALLAGPEDIIGEARVWLRRHGGNLSRMYPIVISAQMGIEKYLPKMDVYHQKAVEIAAAISPLQGIEITPNPPHTNMMRIFFQTDEERLWNVALAIAEETQIWLIGGLSPTQIPGYVTTEITVGTATLDLSTDEIASLFAELLTRAGAGQTAIPVT